MAHEHELEHERQPLSTTEKFAVGALVVGGFAALAIALWPSKAQAASTAAAPALPSIESIYSLAPAAAVQRSSYPILAPAGT